MITRTLSLLLAMSLSGAAPLQAQGDPHQSVGKLVGSFTLHYFGRLSDGRDCPPSPNRLMYALENREGGALKYAHRARVSEQAPPELKALFAPGSFCRVAFNGEVLLLTHHGTEVILQPRGVSAREPALPQPQKAADHEGAMKITYQPVMCQIPPCPPGRYHIKDSQGRQIAGVSVLLVERTDGSVTVYSGRYPDFEQLRGRLYLEEDGKTARIRSE